MLYAEFDFRGHQAMEEDYIYQICLLRKIKNKNVAGSIRSFINLWRGIDPRKLRKEYRGHEWKENERQAWSTSHKAAGNIDGIELLNKARKHI